MDEKEKTMPQIDPDAGAGDDIPASATAHLMEGKEDE